LRPPSGSRWHWRHTGGSTTLFRTSDGLKQYPSCCGLGYANASKGLLGSTWARKPGDSHVHKPSGLFVVNSISEWRTTAKSQIDVSKATASTPIITFDALLVNPHWSGVAWPYCRMAFASVSTRVSGKPTSLLTTPQKDPSETSPTIASDIISPRITNLHLLYCLLSALCNFIPVLSSTLALSTEVCMWSSDVSLSLIPSRTIGRFNIQSVLDL